MELWVELKRLYGLDPEDQLWTQTQNFMHAPVEWKLYDLCRVHQVTATDKDIFMLVEKDYPLRKGLAIRMISYKLQVETYSRMANELGADEELSDEGSPRVIVYRYDGLPMLLVAPPSPVYIPGPEEPQTPPAPQDEDEHEPIFIQPHDPDFVPKPIYPKYTPLEDEHILPAEEQPLPHVVSLTAESPGYVAESDPEEDPEEYEDGETEDGPVDHPIDEGDDGDEDDGDSFGDNADDEDEDEEDEEDEHLASDDSAVVIPTDELVSPPEGIEPVIPPPSTDTATTRARITVRL
nr:hypothetical protein [Tanacetum cinerariifolium]